MNQTVLITGGSRGIGLALARHFARAGDRLILAALPDPELEHAAQSLKDAFPDVQVLTYPVDLTTPDAPQRLWSFVHEHQWHVDVLVNNAGFGTWGEVPRIDVEQELRMIDLNIRAVYSLTRLALDTMQTRDSGHIIFIASIAAFQPNPYMATYGATKAFIRNFGMALYHELKAKRSGIRVTTVCPPAIPTAFREVAGMHRSTLYSGWLSSDVETVARATWKGYLRKSRQVIPTWYLPLINPISRLLPEQFSIWLSRQTLRQNLPG